MMVSEAEADSWGSMVVVEVMEAVAAVVESVDTRMSKHSVDHQD